jgi:nitrogen regulatory protein PII
MIETVLRKRIEILIDSALAPRIVAAAAEAGVSGYTLIPVQSGKGHQGRWRDDGLGAAEAKTIFLTIASDAKAERLVELLAPHLDAYSMLLTVSDVRVVRGERF